jgi:hypothetical protein
MGALHRLFSRPCMQIQLFDSWQRIARVFRLNIENTATHLIVGRHTPTLPRVVPNLHSRYR